MATSSVEICNDALIIIGAKTIQALSDDSQEARLCNEQYAKCRDQLMSAHPWNFAIYQTEIAADADVPTGYWDWEYAHTLASDVLRVLEVQDAELDEWAVEGQKIFADFTPMNIRYIKKITDTTIFSKFFEKALAYELAYRICYALTQSQTLRAALKVDRDFAVAEARSLDAQEKAPTRVESEELIFSRL